MTQKEQQERDDQMRASAAGEFARKEEARVRELGAVWLELVRLWGEMSRHNIHVTGIKLQGGFRGDADTLIVVTAEVDGENMVAFYGAESVGTLWKRLLRKMSGSGLDWRPDRYGRNPDRSEARQE